MGQQELCAHSQGSCVFVGVLPHAIRIYGRGMGIGEIAYDRYTMDGF